MTSQTPAPVATRTKDLSVPALALPAITPAMARKGYDSLEVARADFSQIGEANRALGKAAGAVLYTASLALYRARVSSLIGNGEGQVTQRDYAEQTGQSESVVSRLGTIGKGVAEWGVRHGSADYTALVTVAYGQGGKDRADQRKAISTALKGDPTKDEDREALARAFAAWHAGPPVASQVTEDTREARPEDGGSEPKDLTETTHQRVRTPEHVMSVLAGLQDVLVTFSDDDQDTCISAMHRMIAAVRKSRATRDAEPETVAGEVVTSE